MGTSRCPACGSGTGATVGGTLCPACLLGLALAGPGEDEGAWDLEAEGLRPAMLAVLDGSAERTVYLGERPDTGQLLAVEVLHRASAGPVTPEALRSRVVRLRQLDHPSLARVAGGWATPDGERCLATEYVAGTPLERYCTARGLPARERLPLFLQACRGLAHAHEAGVAHGRMGGASVVVGRREGRPWPVVTGFAIVSPPEGGAAADLAALGEILERLVSAGEGPETAAARQAANRVRAGEIRSVGALVAALEPALQPADQPPA